MYTPLISELAILEIADTKRALNRERKGLGNEFQDAVLRKVSSIANNPRKYRIFDGEIRSTLVGRFNYTIYFRIRPGYVDILTVVHAHRSPEFHLIKLKQAIRKLGLDLD